MNGKNQGSIRHNRGSSSLLIDTTRVPLYTLALLVCFLSPSSVVKASDATVYRDSHDNAHVITPSGTDIQVTFLGNVLKAQYAGDTKTFAWMQALHRGKNASRNEADTLHVMRGLLTKTITCRRLMREFRLIDGGRKVVVSCGGRHFGGQETLYRFTDTTALDSFKESTTPAKQRPCWAIGSREPCKWNLQ